MEINILNKILIAIGLLLFFASCDGSFEFKENTNFESEKLNEIGNNKDDIINERLENEFENNINVENQYKEYDSQIESKSEELNIRLSSLIPDNLEIISDENEGIYEIIINEISTNKEICRFYSNINPGKNELKISTNCEISSEKIYKFTVSFNSKTYSIEVPGIILKSKNQDVKIDIDDNLQLKLNGVYNSKTNSVELSWIPYKGDDLKYYKVVHSIKNSDLKYPEDGYITVISDKLNSNYIDKYKFKEGKNYYRITAVLKDDTKIHSNVVNLFFDSKDSNQYNTELKLHDKSDYILLEWNKYEGDDLQYYKVVHSTTNSNLKYPEDGYIKVITNPNENYYKDFENFKKGSKNYYRITTVLKDGTKIHSNVVYVNK